MTALTKAAEHAARSAASAAHGARQEEDQRSKEEERSNDGQEQLPDEGTANIHVELNAFLAEFSVIRIHCPRVEQYGDRRWVLVFSHARHAARFQFGDRLRFGYFHRSSDLAFFGVRDELRPRDLHAGSAA